MATPEMQNTAPAYPSTGRQIYRNLPEVWAMRSMSPADKEAFTQKLQKIEELREKVDKSLSPEQKALRDQMVTAGRKVLADPNFASLPQSQQAQLAEESKRASKAFGDTLNPEQKALLEEGKSLRQTLPVAERPTPTMRAAPYNPEAARFIGSLSPEQSDLMRNLQQANVRTLPDAEKAFKDSLRPEQQQSFADFQRFQFKRHGVTTAEPGAAPVTVAPVATPAPATSTPAASPGTSAPAATPAPATPPASPSPVTAAAATLHPQQHQAYLKSLGYEVGSLNDTAKNKDQIDAASRKFAVDNKIDPNDKAAITKALQQKAMDGAAAQIDKTQFSVGAGKYSPDDVKVSQWLMKGQGRDMPKSTRADGTVDGIPGTETRKAMPETVIKLKSGAPTVTQPASPALSPAAVPASDPEPARPTGQTAAQIQAEIDDLKKQGANPSPNLGEPREIRDPFTGWSKVVFDQNAPQDKRDATTRAGQANQALYDALSPEQREAFKKLNEMPTGEADPGAFPWMKNRFGNPEAAAAKSKAEMDFLKTLTPEQREKFIQKTEADKHADNVSRKYVKLNDRLVEAQEDLAIAKLEESLTPEQAKQYGTSKKGFFGRPEVDPAFVATLSPQQKLLYVDAQKALEDRHNRLFPVIGRADLGRDLIGRKDIDPADIKDFLSRPSSASDGTSQGRKDIDPKGLDDLLKDRKGIPGSAAEDKLGLYVPHPGLTGTLGDMDKIKELLAKPTVESAGSVSLTKPGLATPGIVPEVTAENKAKAQDVVKMGGM